MTDKISVSVLLDPETLEVVTQLQKEKEIFSRSALLRDLIVKGLQEIEETKM